MVSSNSDDTKVHVITSSRTNQTHRAIQVRHNAFHGFAVGGMPKNLGSEGLTHGRGLGSVRQQEAYWARVTQALGKTRLGLSMDRGLRAKSNQPPTRHTDKKKIKSREGVHGRGVA